jgi:hypothetical protein
MSEYTVKEVNCTTGEEIIRDMTEEEIALFKSEEKLSDTE